MTNPTRIYTEEDWNPTTYDAAVDGTPIHAYQASKKFAELSGENDLLNEDNVPLWNSY